MGVGIARNVRDCYAFIAGNYVAGDELFLFGFSRGAYTARSGAPDAKPNPSADTLRAAGKPMADLGDVERTLRWAAPVPPPVGPAVPEGWFRTVLADLRKL